MGRDRWYGVLAVLVLLVPATPTAAQQEPIDEAARLEFFERKVRPLLVNRCYNCHSANTNSRGGLRVDDRVGLLSGGNRGPAVVPGDPDASLLIQAVRQTQPKLKMPPDGRLSDEEIADLVQWIRDGAAWPKLEIPSELGKQPEDYDELRRTHWAWQPLHDPALPEVNRADWPVDPVDRFVLAKLEAQGLAPVADADPRTLMRRLSFDLTGLPPAPKEVEAFLAEWESAVQSGPQAAAARRLMVEALVDRLLASPGYAERWGRHWLDVARYGESTGSARNVPYPHAWRYRDYVIGSFDRDKPFDRFVQEQIAGDLLPADSPQQREEQLVATGFLALGVKDVNQRFKVRFVMDNIDEQIDAVGRGILALTVSCARCHDHKYEPIPTADYYALAGIFHSSVLCAGVRNKMGGSGMDYYDTSALLALQPAMNSDEALAQKGEELKAALAEAQAALAALTEVAETEEEAEAADDEQRKQKLAEARKEVESLKNQISRLKDPAAHGPVALGVRDAAAVGDTEIRIRGEAEKLGPVVPRGFLSLVEVPDVPSINPQQSGRLELAQWLTSDHNPLTPRVIVNRVWHHLFGRGIVGSVDNFGVTGDLPTHPELLDHLAVRFKKEGWSIKRLVRTLVLTRTYQLSSETTPEHLAADPANRWLWRHSPRRLSAEEIRDSMLWVAGRLEPARPAGSPAAKLPVKELRDDGAEAKTLLTAANNSRHRSIHLPLLRGLVPRSLEVFDFAEQGLVTGSRDTTTVAPQALYLLNDPFVRQQAAALAQLVQQRPAEDESQRIDWAYRRTVGRPAMAEEIARVQQYLADYAAAVQSQEKPPANPQEAAWVSFCHALLASAEFRYLR